MTQSATNRPPDETVAERRVGPAPVVAVLHDGAETVDPEQYLADADGVVVESAASVEAVLDGKESVDSVVYGTPADDVGEALAALASLRERTPSIPFVLLTAEPSPQTLERLFEHDWVDVVTVTPAGTGRRLRHRITALVASRRQVDLARHALAAVEAVKEGVAVVDGEGAITLANSGFARVFGTTPSALHGTDWRGLFDGAAVDRIESDALSAVSDGWEWVGTCAGRRVEGEPVALHTRIATSETDGFVLTVSRPKPRQSE